MKTSLQWLRFLSLFVTLFCGLALARADAPDFSASVKSVNKTSTYLLDSVTYTDALDVTFTAQADLSVSQSDGTATVTAGAPLAYRITVTNNGPSALSNFTLNDSPPAALQNPTFTPDAGAYNPQTGVWSGLDLRAGQSVQMTLSGVVSATASGTLTHTVTVAPPLGTLDLATGNNSSTDSNIIAPPSLVLTQSVDKTEAKTGGIITYTIAYRNGGAQSIGAVQIRTPIPPFTTFVAVSYGTLPAGLTGCTITSPAAGASGNIDWNFSGALPTGGEGVVTFQVKIQ